MRRLEAGLFGDVEEVRVSIVVIQSHSLAFETAGTAGDRHAFPVAAAAGARRRRILRSEIDIVGHGKIEMAIPVVIDKRASGAPSRFRPVKAAFLRLIVEGTVSEIAQ